LKIIKKKTFAGVEIANFKLEIDGWRERGSVIKYVFVLHMTLKLFSAVYSCYWHA
jgi:hypothetical protein